MIETVATCLVKPVADDREYRVVRLNNGLEALLIHDEQTDKASAALDVHVGSLADPVEVPGLAHFLEHLLFMGTEKYPSENEYSQFLSAHAGSYNAYTSAEHTNYYFDIAHEHLYGALDRFAQFFSCPLFSAACKDREILAVDSENKKNLQLDAWRLHQLDKSLSNPKHPYNRFSTGNFETLHTIPEEAGIDVRALLMDFHKNHYSANIMKLVVLGRESLDTLQSWAQTLFSPILNQNYSLPQYPTLPYTPKQLGTLIKARPVMDSHHLELTFPMPDQQPYFRKQPSHYYSHLIGHESKGSLLQYLKDRSWANALSCGSTHVCAGADLFLIDIELTKCGIENWEDVLAATFMFVNLVREQEPQEWVFSELKAMSEATFRYKQKTKPSATTSALARSMQRPYVPREDLLCLGVLKEYSPQALSEFASYLTPDNVRVMLTSQSLNALGEHEKWYGTEYAVEDLHDLLTKFKTLETDPALRLPQPNQLVPENFALLSVDEQDQKFKSPILVTNRPGLRIWHRLDNTFSVPKAYVEVKLSNPRCSTSAAAAMHTEMFVQLVTDSLTDYAYYAEVAGLGYELCSAPNGIEIAIYGFNEKMRNLIEVIVKELRNSSFTQHRFDAIKERVDRQLRNSLYSMPYSQLGLRSNYLLMEGAYSVHEKLAALPELTQQSLADFISCSSGECDIEVLAVGNVDAATAVNLGQDVLRTLQCEPGPRKLAGSYSLPYPSEFYHHTKLEDPNNKNSAIEYRLQLGDAGDLKLRAIALVFAQIIREPAFDQLRTKEQLGYVVGSYLWPIRSTMWLRLFVQSETPTTYVEQRIEAFLASVRKTIETMSAEDFERNVNAVITQHLEKFKNLSEQASYYWHCITSGYYNFNRRADVAKYAKDVTKEQVLGLYDRFVSKTSSEGRAKFVLHLEAAQKFTPSPKLRLAQALVQVGDKYDAKLSTDDIKAVLEADETEEGGMADLERRLAASGLDSKIVPTIVAEVDEYRQDADLGKAGTYVGTEVSDSAEFKRSLTLAMPPETPDFSKYELDADSKL